MPSRLLCHIARTVSASPASSAVAVLCLAAGIGASTLTFSVTDAVLLEPPPRVADAGQVVRLRLHLGFPGGMRQTQLSDFGTPYADYAALRADEHGVPQVAAYATRELSLGRGDGARPVEATFASGTYFAVLGVRPSLGRFFSGSDDLAPESGPVPVVLASWLWTDRFGGDPRIIGRPVRLGQGTYTVVGVAPPGFRGVDFERVGVWLPVEAARRELFDGSAQALEYHEWLDVIARAAHGMSLHEVAARAARTWQLEYAQRFGPTFHGVVAVTPTSIIPYRSRDWSRDADISAWITGMSAILLLIACTNVAILLIIRALSRQRDLAIRLALGATRRHLVEHLAIDGFVLAAVGGIGGLLCYFLGRRALSTTLLSGLTLPDPSAGRILAFAAIVSVLAGVLCAALPVSLASPTRIALGLAGAPNGRRPSRGHLLRTALGVQVALAVTLVACAGLFVRSLANLRATNLGFEPGHVLVGRMPLNGAGYTNAESSDLMTRMQDRVRAAPGVARTSLASTVPFVNSTFWPGYSVPGARANARRPAPPEPVEVDAVAPGFFDALRIPLTQGRAIDDRDQASSTPVVVISRVVAEKYWPHGDALGRCVRLDPALQASSRQPGACRTVIGIAANVRTSSLVDRPDAQLYVPLTQAPRLPPNALVVRATGSAADAAPLVRRIMERAAPDLPFADAQPLAALMEPAFRPWRLGATMFSAFGAIALALALVGIYGTFARAVVERRREIGIRLALGARARTVAWLVVRDAAVVAAAGIACGLLMALAGGRAMRALLVDVSWYAAGPLGGTAVIMVLVVFGAALLPARRALNVDPVETLRGDGT